MSELSRRELLKIGGGGLATWMVHGVPDMVSAQEIEPRAQFIELVSSSGEITGLPFSELNTPLLSNLNKNISDASALYEQYAKDNKMDEPYSVVVRADIQNLNGSEVATPAPGTQNSEGNIPVTISTVPRSVYIPAPDSLEEGDYLLYLAPNIDLLKAIGAVSISDEQIAPAESFSGIHVRPRSGDVGIEAFDRTTSRVYAVGTPKEGDFYMEWNAKFVYNAELGEYEPWYKNLSQAQMAEIASEAVRLKQNDTNIPFNKFEIQKSEPEWAITFFTAHGVFLDVPRLEQRTYTDSSGTSTTTDTFVVPYMMQDKNGTYFVVDAQTGPAESYIGTVNWTNGQVAAAFGGQYKNKYVEETIRDIEPRKQSQLTFMTVANRDYNTYSATMTQALAAEPDGVYKTTGEFYFQGITAHGSETFDFLSATHNGVPISNLNKPTPLYVVSVIGFNLG